MKTKQQKRNEAIARAKTASWEDSKSYRRWVTAGSPDNGAALQWRINNDAHIAHLEGIV